MVEAAGSLDLGAVSFNVSSELRFRRQQPTATATAERMQMHSQNASSPKCLSNGRRQ